MTKDEQIKAINLKREHYQAIFNEMEEAGECGDHVDDIIILLEECEEKQELLEGSTIKTSNTCTYYSMVFCLWFQYES